MTGQRSARADSGIRIVVVSLLTAVLLAGCTGIPASPSPSPSPAASGAPTPDAGQEVTPSAAPQYRPGGTAAQNLQYFTAVVAAFQAANGRGKDSRQVVTALTDAAFPTDAIEVTASTTPNGNAAVSIDASVKFGADCLVATLRDDRYAVDLVPALSTGRCLLQD